MQIFWGFSIWRNNTKKKRKRNSFLHTFIQSLFSFVRLSVFIIYLASVYVLRLVLHVTKSLLHMPTIIKFYHTLFFFLFWHFSFLYSLFSHLLSLLFLLYTILLHSPFFCTTNKEKVRVIYILKRKKFERTEKKKKTEHTIHSRLYYTRELMIVSSCALTNYVI